MSTTSILHFYQPLSSPPRRQLILAALPRISSFLAISLPSIRLLQCLRADYSKFILPSGGTLPASLRFEFFRTLQETTAPRMFAPRAAYDGRKNMFATSKFSFRDSGEFDASLATAGAARSLSPGEGADNSPPITQSRRRSPLPASSLAI
ncbi:hypothetical protein EVG20_g5996 [Dentipellis fragilis]|uniref:Uncharacterized protein n=1 Tax=Dentipellis fragilis TaxID=205917 RepID=A0A4Y9YRD7_9AGAM|nr:hypothetical protein EVG20_g5996 [Dentipellis fragilis]